MHIRMWVGLSLVVLALLGAVSVTPAADDPATKKAVLYKEDFADPKKFETDAEVNNGLKHFPGIGLSSAGQGGGFLIYDLQKLLPGAPEKAQFALAYAGGANGPDDLRGPRWSVGDDGKSWTEFSVNQFNVPVTFSGRYLKLFIHWKQAGGPDYGKVSGFTLKVKPDVKAGEKRTEYLAKFETPDQFDADAGANSGLRVAKGFGLSSAGQTGFAVYAVADLLPGVSKDAKITLQYSGVAAGPADLRGVRWAVSDDGKKYTEFSVNEFDKVVAVPAGVYLRVFIQWRQAGGPDYGFLKNFTLKAEEKK
jgi:hypothetical protein